MGTEQDLRRIAELAAEAADRLERQEYRALEALLTEMRALGDVLPGLPGVTAIVPRRSGAQPAGAFQSDAEIEAGFDNMPI
ncbi:MAG: hypothetical protein ACK4VZ_15855 [Paracoccaceae bacterium]